MIQSKSKQKTDPKGAAATGSDSTMTGEEASSSMTSAGPKSKKGKGWASAVKTARPEESHPVQQKVPEAVSSRAPMGLWAHVWAANLSWLDTVDGYSSWCSICHDGGDVLLCDIEGCKAAQHAACSMQSDARAQQWRCDDCWLLADE